MNICKWFLDQVQKCKRWYYHFILSEATPEEIDEWYMEQDRQLAEERAEEEKWYADHLKQQEEQALADKLAEEEEYARRAEEDIRFSETTEAEVNERQKKQERHEKATGLTFEFRIIEEEYQNYLFYDDGPGSSTSVEATCRSRIIGAWKDKPESFGADLLKGGHRLYLQENSSDGYFEYRYILERAVTGTDSWKWQGHLSRREDDY